MDFQSIAQLKNEEIGYTETEAVKQARQDFRYVCEQSNLFISTNIKLLALSRNNIKVADALPIPFDTAKKIARFPQNLVKLDDPKMFVAAVCYADGKPIDVLMLNSALFAHPKKFIKADNKMGEFILKIKDIKKEVIRQYGFGLVVQKL